MPPQTLLANTEKNMITISRICTVTNKEYKVVCPLNKYNRWKTSKEPIQKVLPLLSNDAREFLISNTTPAEWDSLMSEF